MTYNIYEIVNGSARECLAHCENEQELNEWRNTHPEYKGRLFVGRNWD